MWSYRSSKFTIKFFGHVRSKVGFFRNSYNSSGPVKGGPEDFWILTPRVKEWLKHNEWAPPRQPTPEEIAKRIKKRDELMKQAESAEFIPVTEEEMKPWLDALKEQAEEAKKYGPTY